MRRFHASAAVLVATFAALPLAAVLAACHAAPPTAAAVWPADHWSAGDPYAPELGNRGYEVGHYDLRVALDPARADFGGTATLTLTATAPGLAWLALDLAGLEAGAVQVDGRAAEHIRLGGKLLVRLPAPRAAGERFTLTVAYGGRPVAEQSRYVPFFPHLGLQRHDGVAFVVSEPDGARNWFPCNDHPTDKATFRIEVAVPPGLAGVANGTLVDTRRAVADALGPGRSGDVFAWEMRQPMATYLATAVAGAFTRVEGRSPKGVPLRHYVPAALAERFARMNGRIGEALDWMGERYGPYPFGEFGFVVVPGMPGGFESQGMVILGRGLEGDEGILLHELAHQWFGDWVTPASWRDMWFNEGFAVWVSEHAWTGKPSDGAAGAPPASPHCLGHPPCRELFGQVTYYKGAAFVAALRAEMGEAAFDRGLRAFLDAFGGRSFTRAEFQQAMEQAAGKPLGKLFAAWLDEKGG